MRSLTGQQKTGELRNDSPGGEPREQLNRTVSDTVRIGRVEPAPAKPKFSSSRAQIFTGTGGYWYAYDPETNVIAIVKSPNRPKGSPPVYLRPDGKFPDAHKAIMAEYRASMKTPDDTTMESPAAPPPPPPLSSPYP